MEVYRLTARCPGCGAPLRIRNTAVVPAVLEAADRGGYALDPDTIVQTYMCPRRNPDDTFCNTLVEIRVKHWRKVG